MSRRKAIQSQTYVFRITSWEPDYSFSINKSDFWEGPYREHFAIDLSGTFLSPPKAENRTAVLKLLAQRSLNQAMTETETNDHKPSAVGGLTIRGKTTDYLGSIPFDAGWGLVSLLTNERIQYAHLYGEALFRGKAKIWSMSFSRDTDPDDW